MLIKPIFASLLLILTSNVVNGGDLAEYYRCGDCVQASWWPTSECSGETTWEGCLKWQSLCRWERYDCPTAPPDDGGDATKFRLCANDAGLETCTSLFDAMYSRTMQASCVAWFSYEEIASDGFCYMCGGNTIPDIQQLLDGGCNSETIACLNTSKQPTTEGTGWFKRTYCCHKDLSECVQFVEYVQDVDCNDETLGDGMMMSEPSCKFFTISSCPEGVDVCDGL